MTAAERNESAPEGICEVEALTPDSRYTGGLPAAVWGRAKYRCTKDNGKLTVRLRRRVRFFQDITAAEKTYDAPMSSGWSKVFTTPEANCSAGGRGAEFHTDVKHAHPHALDGNDKGDPIKACG